MNPTITRLTEGYYSFEPGTPIKGVRRRWQAGDKAYDPDEDGRHYHEIYRPHDVWGYREYTWSRDKSRHGPEEWDQLEKSMLADGWNPRRPALVQVGKNGVVKVDEGNHRLAIAMKHNIPVPVRFLFYTNVELDRDSTRENIEELFEPGGFAYKIKWKSVSGDNWSGSFSTEDGHQYGFRFEAEEPGIWYIEFWKIGEEGTLDSGVTGTGRAAKVLSTVLMAIGALIDGADVKGMVFTSSEPSRTKLYKRLSKKIGREHGFAWSVRDIGFGATFTLTREMSHATAGEEDGGGFGSVGLSRAPHDTTSSDSDPFQYNRAGFGGFGSGGFA